MLHPKRALPANKTNLRFLKDDVTPCRSSPKAFKSGTEPRQESLRMRTRSPGRLGQEMSGVGWLFKLRLIQVTQLMESRDPVAASSDGGRPRAFVNAGLPGRRFSWLATCLAKTMATRVVLGPEDSDATAWVDIGELWLQDRLIPELRIAYPRRPATRNGFDP
ncbi:hypothetical protein BaRGS_00004795, partial [Batillaria attramentaria]